MKKSLISLLCLCLIFTFSFTSFSVAYADEEEPADYMQSFITQLGDIIDGEEAFDYLSYTYMGWRTTGGRWQNQVISEFVPDQLIDAGYNFVGKSESASNAKSETDMSSVHDDDYAWVTYYNDVSSTVWDPEYARMEVIVPDDLEGVDDLVDRIQGEYYGFNPCTDTYIEHYGKLYGINDIDSMWAWITEKDENGTRINVENGLEAELNQRCHLAWQTCFTDPTGTKPEDAQGVTGEAVYVGTISGRAPNMRCSLVSDLSTLEGKAILSDSSLSNTWSFAQQVGGVAAMSTNSLSNYNLPMDENGEVIAPFKYSARYANGGSLANTIKQTETGKPIVSWQFSVDQKAALKELLEKAGDKPVTIKSVSVGDTYAMNDPEHGGKGQAVTFAEIKGSKYPDERVLICAHVQEPGSNDNATGVGCLTGMAKELKRAVDEGRIERPERTITFLWGDEMTMARLYISSHSEECKNLIMSLDMDMAGEDPDKTGGTMRVEKSPDPSAKYLYTLDLLPWEDTLAYDETYTSVHPDNEPGKFVRLPDSHTLWGAGGIGNLFQEGYYLNDLYINAANSVTKYVDDGFRVDVCPYEGGSDHSVFLQNNIPAVLTWHFTDYTYHSSVDTLYMSSAREMGNVNITTAATAYLVASAIDENEDVSEEILKIVRNAAIDRISNVEKENTDHHVLYASKPDKNVQDELEAEKEVLQAWGDWYEQAIRSVGKYLLTEPSAQFLALEEEYSQEIIAATEAAKKYADDIFMVAGVEKAQAAAEAAQAEAEAAKAEAAAAQEAAAAAQAEAEAAQAAAEAAQADAEAAQAEAEAAKADAAAAQEAAEAAQAKADEAQAAADEANEKAAAAQAALEEAQSKLAEAEAAVQDAQAAADTAQAAADDATAKADATQAALDEAAKAQEELKAEIASLKKQIAQSRTVTGLKLTQKSRKVTVKYAKTPGATSYQIQYKRSSNKTWKSLKKSTTAKKATTKKLTKGKKYTFRVRAITKIDGKKVYGKWTTKTIKIKK